jgi:hypothetical protein
VTQDEIQGLRILAAEATPRPWSVDERTTVPAVIRVDRPMQSLGGAMTIARFGRPVNRRRPSPQHDATAQHRRNATYVAVACAALPDVLDALEHALARIAELEAGR